MCAFRFVRTDTGNEGARRAGIAEAPDTIKDSAVFIAGMVSRCSYYSSDGRRLTRSIGKDRRGNNREHGRPLSELL